MQLPVSLDAHPGIPISSLGISNKIMLEIIDRTPLFQTLDHEQLEMLAPMFEEFNASASSVIFEQGDPAAYLYILITGTVALRYRPYDGPQITLAHLHGGEIFGWSSVIGNPTYTSTVFTNTDIKTVRVRGAQLRRFCGEKPEVACTLLEKMAESVSPRWKNARDQVEGILKHSLH